MNEDGEITDGRRIINIDEIGQAHAFGGQKRNSVPRVVWGGVTSRGVTFLSQSTASKTRLTWLTTWIDFCIKCTC
jgi:hypothetical protein